VLIEFERGRPIIVDRTLYRELSRPRSSARTTSSRPRLFGPAVAVTSVSGIDAAVELANSTSYGLGAGVFTGNVANAVRFTREVDAGNVHINWTPLWRADLMPYGGLKGSGIGKEGPRAAVQEMTDVKTIVLHGNR
jgi:acyl-CoA reductase-like NAD-dependent aldehyde dehydrogenase